MIKHTTFFSRSLFFFILLLSITSCNKQIDLDNSASGNLKALWHLIDEHYCFLEYKQIDWDSVYNAFIPRVKDPISNEALLDIMDEMLDLLQDGHVNVSAGFNTARYWEWFENYPENFDQKVQKNYLSTDYAIAGGIKYKILDDNVGYLYYASFNSTVSSNSMDHILNNLDLCNGIIIDIRDNGGGNLNNVHTIASAFTDKKVLTGYICHKRSGKHNDFSDPYPIYLEPRSKTTFNFYKPVVVLTNRHCYSAANDFVNTMKQLPNVTIIGDKTGGGSGLPFSSELPNGWSVRFSSSPIYDPQMNHIEFGILPDLKVDMDSTDIQNGIDTIIETAREYIAKQS